MNIRLRRATEADAAAIEALAHRIWFAHYLEIVSAEQVAYMLADRYTQASLCQQMQTPNHDFWLPHTDDGTLLGFLHIAADDQQPTPGHYFLHKFYLDNGQRGAGVGATVFAQLLAQYTDVQGISLYVNRRNFRSVNFYFKMGFRIERWLDQYTGPYLLDDYLMHWKPS